MSWPASTDFIAQGTASDSQPPRRQTSLVVDVPMPLVRDTIFDLDGTLVDSAPRIIECCKQTLLEQDIQLFRVLSTTTDVFRLIDLYE